MAQDCYPKLNCQSLNDSYPIRKDAKGLIICMGI